MDTVAHPEGVFTWPSDEPQLIGGRCVGCAAVAFPLPPSCPRCGRDLVHPARAGLDAGNVSYLPARRNSPGVVPVQRTKAL